MSRSLLSLILLIAATLLFLFWKTLTYDVLHIFSATYNFLIHTLSAFIYDHRARQMIAVLLVSLILGLIPVFIYWVFSRRWLYEYMTFVWCIWIVIMTMISMKGYHV